MRGSYGWLWLNIIKLQRYGQMHKSLINAMKSDHARFNGRNKTNHPRIYYVEASANMEEPQQAQQWWMATASYRVPSAAKPSLNVNRLQILKVHEADDASLSNVYNMLENAWHLNYMPNRVC